MPRLIPIDQHNSRSRRFDIRARSPYGRRVHGSRGSISRHGRAGGIIPIVPADFFRRAPQRELGLIGVIQFLDGALRCCA